MNQWFLIFCKRAEQDRAVVHLERQGVQCYYPKIITKKIVRGSYKTQLEPLFPCYLFTCFDPEKVSYTTVRSTRGVSRFITQGSIPKPIPESLIEHLKIQEKSPEAPINSSIPEKGEKLQLKDGQFNGVTAIYLEPDGEKRSFMLLDILNTEVIISIDNLEIDLDSLNNHS